MDGADALGLRGPLAAALWAMILKIGIGLFRSSLVTLSFMTNGGQAFGSRGFMTGGGGLFADLGQNLAILLMLSETGVFMGAMILFVYGIQKLRRRPQPFPGHRATLA